MKFAAVDDEVRDVCARGNFISILWESEFIDSRLAVASNIYDVERPNSTWMDDKSDAKTCAESMGMLGFVLLIFFSPYVCADS
jgi:hypothetical protein